MAWRRLGRSGKGRGGSRLLDSRNARSPQYAAFSDACARAAAAATSILRVGTLVLANDLRHPLLVARDAATVDTLSSGRFELGLGAGWLRDDYVQLGATFDPPRTRVRRLAEAITVVRGSLREPGFAFTGSYYSVAVRPPGLPSVPRPVPILVGGGGREILRLAARQADIVSVNPDLRGGVVPPFHRGVPVAAVDRQLGWVKEAAGHRYPELEINVMLQIADVGRDWPEFASDGGLRGYPGTVLSPQVAVGG